MVFDSHSQKLAQLWYTILIVVATAWNGKDNKIVSEAVFVTVTMKGIRHELAPRELSAISFQPNTFGLELSSFPRKRESRRFFVTQLVAPPGSDWIPARAPLGRNDGGNY